MVTGSCKYGNEKCWFIHGDSKGSTEDENTKKSGASNWKIVSYDGKFFTANGGYEGDEQSEVKFK